MRYTKHARRAFTLIEIMIVVLIIGILLAIAVPNFVRARESARAKSCVANLKAITGAWVQYSMDNRIAAGSGTLVTPSVLVSSGYLKALPNCPSNGTYNRNVGPGGDDFYSCTVGGTAGDPLAHTLP